MAIDMIDGGQLVCDAKGSRKSQMFEWDRWVPGFAGV